MNEENTIQDTELMDDSWGDEGDIDLSDIADDTDETSEETETPPEGEADPAAPEDAKTEDEPKEDAEGDHTFTLNYMGEHRTVTKDEVISLAQQGMDYDRIRTARDEALAEGAEIKRTLSYVEELAKNQGMTLDEMIDGAHVAILVNKEGLSPEAAAARVKIERRERELNMREEALNKKTQTDTAAQEAEAKRLADIKAFAAKFPGVEPKSISPEVWAEVSKGATLTEAYTAYENRQLKLQLEAEKKNRENAAISPGSRSSDGQQDKVDPIDKYWDEED